MSDIDSKFELRKQLTSVRAAISRIESGGASASIGDMSYSEADIGALYLREKNLIRRLNRKSGKRPGIKQVRIV